MPHSSAVSPVPRLVRREAILSVGRFEPRLFIGGAEALFSYDLADASWSMVYLLTATVHHYQTMGNCHHRRYIPQLLRLIRNGSVDPEVVLTQRGPLSAVLAAYQALDSREEGWIKVKLEPEPVTN